MHETRPIRIGIRHPTFLVRADGSKTPATITNVSQKGFRLNLPETLTPGEEVVVQGEAGDVPAQIRWSLGNAAGGIFLQPTDD